MRKSFLIIPGIFLLAQSGGGFQLPTESNYYVKSVTTLATSACSANFKLL